MLGGFFVLFCFCFADLLLKQLAPQISPALKNVTTQWMRPAPRMGGRWLVSLVFLFSSELII